MFKNLTTTEKVLVIILAIILIIIIIAFEGWLLASIWNWLMPTIFGFTTITYQQGIGILFLCNMLFKSHSTKIKKDN